ncbi:acyltransferase family protein [Rosistilla oblonga]|uniref:acyltransferase family protein n=1 Tax=Rosistilla oblonga TaxID=2527990 RepID=UPI003A96AD65
MATPLISNFQYRPEIDGLRAIAVIVVVLFHAGLGVPGGFIGVDVFFVISGFLITSLIIKDLESGTFTLANFWERRARRILPASVVMVLTVLIAGWFLLLPSDYANLGESTIWQSVFGANLFFWRSINYFSGPADEMPLLHTWSLAVEEQFYLFVPLLLAGLFRFPRWRSRHALLLLLGVSFSISLCMSIIAVPRTPAAAFYLLPTRAWELLIGSIIAVLPAAAITRSLRETLCCIGLAAILLPCFVYSKVTPFPGLAALPPCLGTALFIWAASKRTKGNGQNTEKLNTQHKGLRTRIKDQERGVATKPPFSVRFLSSNPIVFVGLISYSLYLWHWPLFAFNIYWALAPLSLGYRLLLVAASFALAIISWRFIETPFRLRRRGATRPALFGWGFGGLGVSAASALVLVLLIGFPQRFSARVLRIDAAKQEVLHENRVTRSITLEDALNGGFPRLGASPPAPVSLIVWGDSHARSILPAANALASEHLMGMLTAWRSATPPVIGYERPGPRHSSSTQKVAFNQAVLDYIEKNRIPVVLLAARWSTNFTVHSDPSHCKTTGNFEQCLINTVSEIRKTGSKVFILLEVPNHKVSVPKALLAQEILGTDISQHVSTREYMNGRDEKMLALVPKLKQAGAEIIDITETFFDTRKQRYRIERNGRALYYDNHHLTKFGAISVQQALSPVFQEIFEIQSPAQQ